MKKISIVLMAAFTALSGIVPATAAPLYAVPKQPVIQTDIDQVQYRHDRDRRGPPRWERDRRPDYRRPPPRHGWHNGHQGYRDRRPGYRRHNDGWWYPLAAFGAGAIIGGAIANQPAPPPPAYGRVSQAHINWCSSRYRTYRAYDNTYAPQVGVRAQCVSPY